MASEPKSTSSRVLVRAYVDRETLTKFRAQFPMHGSFSWILQAAMTEVLAITDGQPELETLVRQSIRSTLLRNRIAGRHAANDATTSASEQHVSAAPFPINLTTVKADR